MAFRGDSRLRLFHGDFSVQEITVTSFLRPAAVLIVIMVSTLMAPSGANAQLEETSSEIADHMHENLDQIGIIKAAVIAGNLADVREPANWLATHEEPASLPSVEEMRRYAERAAAAEDLVDAAAAVGEIGRTCGECHQASGFRIAMGFSAPPAPQEQSFAKQMQRHLWAADRMWAGLVGPSDAAWKQGADILAEVELAASDIVGEGDQQSQISDLMQRMRAVGEQASQAASVELRSGLYGEFLSLCATCHNLTGGGPAAR
jgi:mono/diheme cytochrome c family protein